MSIESTAPASADQLPTNSAATTPPQRPKLKRSTRISLVVILIVAVIAAAGYGVSYFLDARNYVTTDNAQVDGNQIMINAPATGTLLDWSATEGTVVRQNQAVGRIEIQNAFAQP